MGVQTGETGRIGRERKEVRDTFLLTIQLCRYWSLRGTRTRLCTSPGMSVRSSSQGQLWFMG